MQAMSLFKRTLVMAAAVLGLFTAAADDAQAQAAGIRAKEYTAGEQALLPEWCIDSQDGPYGSPEGGSYTNKSPRAPAWVNAMGSDFWHMHHYCRGLRDTMRLRSAGLSGLDKNFLTQRAVSEFYYVINNCKPTMPLMPEVYLKLGEVYLLQQNLPEAQAAFERSRELKPDYWPAYDRWIGVLMGLKQFDTARALVKEGLAHSPAEPTLLARSAALDAAAGSGNRGSAKPQKLGAAMPASAAAR